jgi:hypothetical protein
MFRIIIKTGKPLVCQGQEVLSPSREVAALYMVAGDTLEPVPAD